MSDNLTHQDLMEAIPLSMPGAVCLIDALRSALAAAQQERDGLRVTVAGAEGRAQGYQDALAAEIERRRAAEQRLENAAKASDHDAGVIADLSAKLEAAQARAGRATLLLREWMHAMTQAARGQWPREWSGAGRVAERTERYFAALRGEGQPEPVDWQARAEKAEVRLPPASVVEAIRELRGVVSQMEYNYICMDDAEQAETDRLAAYAGKVDAWLAALRGGEEKP